MTTEAEQAVRSAFAAGASAPTQETLDKFAADMRARGIDASATLAKHAVQQAGDPQSDARADLQPTINAATGVRGLSPSEVATAADTLRKFWTGDQAELDAALERAGAPTADTAPDTRTDAEREFDGSSLGARAPEEYELNGLWLGRDADMHDAATTTDAIRTALSALSVPKVAGLSFAEAVVDSRAQTESLAELSPEAQQTWHMQQKVDFARATKVGWEEAAAQMRPWLAKMPAETRDFLSVSGAFNSVTAMVRLWSTFQLVEARAKMGKKS